MNMSEQKRYSLREALAAKCRRTIIAKAINTTAQCDASQIQLSALNIRCYDNKGKNLFESMRFLHKTRINSNL